MTADEPAVGSTWVIGAGGLLGSALAAQLRRRGRSVMTTPLVPWHDPMAAVGRLRDVVRGLAGCSDRPFRLAWCAGAGVTGTSTHALADEVEVLTAFLHDLEELDPAVLDAFFFASSAGGLYAGSPEPPFTEAHPVVPISPYGRAKRAAEKAVLQFAQVTDVPTVIGRIANLYGAAQNLNKPQGLIAHLCWAHLKAQPVSIYVSLDTLRDYIFVDDCAAMVADSLDHAARLEGTVGGRLGAATVKIFASQQAVTIGALLGECRRVFKRAPLVVLGSSPTAEYQTRDLRLRSTVWTTLDQRSLTTLPTGIRATSAGLLRSMQTSARPPSPWSAAPRGSRVARAGAG
jgi:UDP-glucose 4-epimerase